MNIEYMRKAVETVLERKIDPTVWDRFARAEDTEYKVVELIAHLFEGAEPDISRTLGELDAEEAALSGEEPE